MHVMASNYLETQKHLLHIERLVEDLRSELQTLDQDVGKLVVKLKHKRRKRWFISLFHLGRFIGTR